MATTTPIAPDLKGNKNQEDEEEGIPLDQFLGQREQIEIDLGDDDYLYENEDDEIEGKKSGLLNLNLDQQLEGENSDDEQSLEREFKNFNSSSFYGHTTNDD